MITRTENAIAARTAQQSLVPAQRTPKTAENGFAGLLQLATQPAAAAKSATPVVANTAPAAAAPQSAPATAATANTKAVSLQSDLTQLPSPFSPEAFERQMNTWLVSTINRQNQQKMDTYNQAMHDWNLNATRCRELGLPVPPPPPPPQQETAAAMPSGWWFQANS